MKEKTIERIRKFTEDRDWDQFHSPANLAKSIVIEAAELLECFQWNETEYDLQHIKEELADVLVYSQNLLDKLELDADEIVNMKMEQNEAKYPVDKAKGNAVKYTELQVVYLIVYGGDIMVINEECKKCQIKRNVDKYPYNVTK